MAATAEVKAEVEQAVLAAVEHAGSRHIDKTAIVRAFQDRASRSALFRWIGEALDGGKPGAALGRKVRAAAEERASAAGVPVPDAAGTDAVAEAALAAAQLPVPVRVEDIAGGAGALDVISRLNACIAAAERVMRFAAHPDGAVRAPKLTLQAAETLRRSLDTSVKLYQAMRDVQAVDRFHQAVLAEVARESPECARRIVQRLSMIATEYGG